MSNGASDWEKGNSYHYEYPPYKTRKKDFDIVCRDCCYCGKVSLLGGGLLCNNCKLEEKP